MTLLRRDGVAQHVDAQDRDRARVGAQQARHHSQCGGLPSAIGPQEGVNLAWAHYEIQAIHCRPIEMLAQPANLKRA